MNDVRKIGFVSKRYLELQGLIPAAFGGGLLLAALTFQVLGGGRPGNASQVMLFGMLAGSAPASLYLQRSYKRTFGDVVASRRQKFMATLQTTVVSIGATIDMTRTFNGHSAGPSAAALALVAYSMAVVVRDWRWRSHHLISVGGGLAAVYVTASLSSIPDRWGIDPLAGATYLLAYTLIGFSLVMTGLFDHHLLASALRSGVDADRPVVASPLRPVAVVRTWIAAMVCGSAGLSLQFDPRWVGMSFPTTLMVALLAVFLVISVQQTVRAFRDFPNVREPVMPILRVDAPASMTMAAVGVAATVQTVLLADRPPVLLIGAVAAACVWHARSNWRDRWPYLLIAVAAIAALPFTLRVDPARGFLVSVFAIALGFVLHGLVACWRAFAREYSDANTV